MLGIATALLTATCVLYVFSERLDISQLALNKCFRYMKGYRLQLFVNDIESTESVQFKDDCLRACLRTTITGDSFCKSLMHMPVDNDCVLTSVDGSKAFYTGDRKTEFATNFYENVCAKPKEGGKVEAKMRGYRGGEGIINMVEKKGRPTELFIVVDGLDKNKAYDVLHADVDYQNCILLTNDDVSAARKITSINSDRSGMAVQPWTPINFPILSDSIINKTLAIVDNETRTIEICGGIKVKGTHEEWALAKNSAFRLSTILIILTIICCVSVQFILN